MTPFADLQTSVNDAVMTTLADTTATWGAITVPVIFAAPASEALGVSGYAPKATALESDLPGIGEGDAITISGRPYVVVAAEPDGAGMVNLQLREGA